MLPNASIANLWLKKDSWRDEKISTDLFCVNSDLVNSNLGCGGDVSRQRVSVHAGDFADDAHRFFLSVLNQQPTRRLRNKTGKWKKEDDCGFCAPFLWDPFTWDTELWINMQHRYITAPCSPVLNEENYYGVHF